MTYQALFRALSDHTASCPSCRLAAKGNQPERLCLVGRAILHMIRDREQAAGQR